VRQGLNFIHHFVPELQTWTGQTDRQTDRDIMFIIIIWSVSLFPRELAPSRCAHRYADATSRKTNLERAKIALHRS